MRTDNLRRLKEALDAADLVLVGASNGLDIAEGLNIFASDQHFLQTYGDLAQTSGARSILEGLYLSQGDLSKAWAWQARFARREWIGYQPGTVLRTLRALTENKDHFVLTCNLSARFRRAEFDKDLVLETEGTVAEMMCSNGCCSERYPAEGTVRTLNASIVNGRVNEELIPACPHCGAPLVSAIDEQRMRHRDTTLRNQLVAFERLVAQYHNSNIVVLELGVGMRNRVIKHMLAQAVTQEQNLTYAVFNYDQVVFPLGLEPHCIAIPGDMNAAFRDLDRML